MIKYIGSKRVLIPVIIETIRQFPKARSVLDLFSGTSRVGQALKREGFRVTANDHNAYSYVLAKCYVETNLNEVERHARSLISEFNRLPGRSGFFTDTYCIQAKFFQPQNGERIDAIRESIKSKSLPPKLESVLLVSLMEAADRVDSTTGLQMAYLKKWAQRAYNPLELRMPDVLPRAKYGNGKAHQRDALEEAREAKADIAYLDPPYNQHKYLGNYHIWETLVLWDNPEVYGVAKKRIDCKTRKSVFNSKLGCENALKEIIAVVQAKLLIVSFNDEGYIDRETMESLLSQRGEVRIITHGYKRYVGAQIGIYNPSGEKVGKVSHLRNTEYLFIAGDFEKLGFCHTNELSSVSAPLSSPLR
jgi:adenine-specific DNA-methyltransferase